MLGTMMRKIPFYLLAAWICAIFLDSLRFKFTGHPTTVHIFDTLREWSGIGLFYPAGPWIIGLGELTASLLVMVGPLLVQFTTGKREHAALSQALGGLLAAGIMTGAITFHLFTPLGIQTPTGWENGEPTGWSPALFIAACLTWVIGLTLAALRSKDALSVIRPSV